MSLGSDLKRDRVSQAIAAVPTGANVRTSFFVSGITGGSARVHLERVGVSSVDGPAQSVNGLYLATLTATDTYDFFAVRGTPSLAASVDDVAAFIETPTCRPAGLNYYWLEPQNSDGVPGPLSGPFTVTIR